MGNFIINEIFSDGYERWANVKDLKSGKMLNVYFLEYDEYLEGGVSKKRQKGDFITGVIKLSSVFLEEANVEGDLLFKQPIKNSPHLEAIIEVLEVLDGFTIMAYLLDFKDPIEVDFETNTLEKMKVGAKIKITGTLEVDIKK